MNHITIGMGDTTDFLLEHAKPPFLLIDDGPVADDFAAQFPKAQQFDLTTDSFNPLKGMNYKRARDFVSTLYSASPEGENTLTVRNGKRALMRLLMAGQARLDRLKGHHDPEAVAMIDDLLLSPVLKNVLCNPTNVSFKKSLIVRLDRAELGDFDAFVLGLIFIGHHKGQVIVPDFGFYGRDQHISLIRQGRLLAGVRFLSDLTVALRQTVMLVADKVPSQCTWEDAEALARYAGLAPNTNEHTEFLQSATS